MHLWWFRILNEKRELLYDLTGTHLDNVMLSFLVCLKIFWGFHGILTRKEQLKKSKLRTRLFFLPLKGVGECACAWQKKTASHGKGQRELRKEGYRRKP